MCVVEGTQRVVIRVTLVPIAIKNMGTEQDVYLNADTGACCVHLASHANTLHTNDANERNT